MSAAASDEGRAVGREGEAAEIESQTDRHETRLEYDPTSRVPIPVVIVWICALIGLGAYTVIWLLPELSLWGRP